MTKQDFINRFHNQKKDGLATAAKLGQRIIDRAIWCEKTKTELPFLIADFRTLRFHVKLIYKGMLGDIMTFALVDMHDPEYGVHDYLKLYLGDTGAFFLELVREMGYIYCLHDNK